jgi:Outer membrane protein beta-barrel domain
MQKTIVATLAVLASTAAAYAVDLPSKRALPAAPVPTFAQDSYVGLNVGGNVSGARVYTGGAVAGWNVNPFLAVEGDYSYSRPDAATHGKRDGKNAVSFNALPQYKIPGTDFTAYALGGVGYQWDSVTADHSIYKVGGGLKYDFAKDWQVDGRFTRTDAIKSQYRGYEDRATVGVNYKF